MATKRFKKYARKTIKRGGASAGPINHNQLTLEGNGNKKVIKFDGVAVGHVDSKVIGHTYHLDLIYIEPSYRSRRIGKFALKKILEEAFHDGSGVTRIELSDQTKSNQFNPNHGEGRVNNEMYTQCGFKYINDRYTGYPGARDDMVLTKEDYEMDKPRIDAYLQSPTVKRVRSSSKGGAVATEKSRRSISLRNKATLHRAKRY